MEILVLNQGKPEEIVKMNKSNTTLNLCTTILDEKPEKMEAENANDIENLQTNIIEPENPCVDDKFFDCDICESQFAGKVSLTEHIHEGITCDCN